MPITSLTQAFRNARPGWDAIPAIRDGKLHEIKSPRIPATGPRGAHGRRIRTAPHLE
jgi:hypothetical protein